MFCFEYGLAASSLPCRMVQFAIRLLRLRSRGPLVLTAPPAGPPRLSSKSVRWWQARAGIAIDVIDNDPSGQLDLGARGSARR